MRLADFDFDLPEDRIARVPTERRDAARLLLHDRERNETEHRSVADLPRILRRGDLLVVNDVRVEPARLDLVRASGGRIEALVLQRREADLEVMLQGSARLRPGEALAVAGSVGVRIVLGERNAETWQARVEGISAEALLGTWGRVPLPPYIRKARGRDGVAEEALEALDRERYQTVFARGGMAAAAPTAGLHLTRDLLDQLMAAGIEWTRIRLEVGPGTFAPIRSDDPRAHRLGAEVYEIEEEAARVLERARSEGRRVVAVGTTVVRTLESVWRERGRIDTCRGATSLLLAPGDRFGVVGALLTNFHLPRSSLLLLVSAFAGRERVLSVYANAIERGYRFYSYGDAMLIL